MSTTAPTVAELEEAFDLTPYIVRDGVLMDLRPMYPGHGYNPERLELLDRLNRRWADGVDPGLPPRVERLLR